MDDRYRRNGLSETEQKRLHKASVSVIGCGGLGGRTAELLARLGVGNLSLTDPDIFDASNLNRQLFSTPETLGLAKAEVVAAELDRITPEITLDAHVESFGEHSVKGADVVIDGLDSADGRRELARICRSHKIPLIHGAVKQWYGQAGVDSTNTPLIDTLYPRGGKGGVPEVLPMTVALVAAMQAAEACKLLLGKPSPLQNGWLQCDLLHCDYEQLTVIKGKA